MDVALPAGYAARPYRGPLDHLGMTRVRNEAEFAAGGGELRTIAQMDNGYAHLVNCDPATDVVLIEGGDDIVAYGRVAWNDPLDEQERTYEMLGWAVPAHHAVLPGLGRWLDRRARGLAANHNRSRFVLFGEAPLPPPAAPPEPYRWAVVLADLGLEVVRHQFSMVRPDLTDAVGAPLPDGVEMRPVASEHLRAIWEAHATAFLDHPGAVVAGEEDWEEFVGFPHRDESLWKVAWAGDDIVGQVRSFVNAEENERFGRRRGYTEFISTARPWRGKGVAAALLSASIVELRARGCTEAALGVMAENPTGALHLYTKLGFEPYTDVGVFRRVVDV